VIALVNLLVCLGIAIAGGLGSAIYMIASGSPLTTRQVGPWQVWKDAGRVEADPYTRAHFATSGRLPTGSRNALYFLASRDSTGSNLAANCDYTISGSGPDAQWWSLSAYTRAGQLFANAAERYAYSSATVMRSADGSYAITVSRDARAGNWLPVNGAEPVRLMLSVYGLESDGSRKVAGRDQAGLPVIRRGACR
jgi:hypothetical protein